MFDYLLCLASRQLQSHAKVHVKRICVIVVVIAIVSVVAVVNGDRLRFNILIVLKLVAGGVVTVGVLLLNVVFLNPLLVLLDGVLLKEPLGEVNKCSKDDVLPPPPPPLPPLLLLETNLVALAAGVEDVTGVAYVKCLAFLPAKAKAKPLSEPAANKLECCAFEC
ncbi:hypothetical protein GQX74_010510 [Glossina fuscipes]|nr:hypothetical protein GQX74_010510 [Glossina fuscipes]